MQCSARTIRRSVSFAVLVLVCFTPDIRSAPSWHRIRSGNFELLTTAGEKKGRSLVQYFEQVRRFFIANMKIPEDPDTQVVHIVAFDTIKEFSPFRISSSSRAFYTGGTRGDYIVMASAATDSYPLAVHEYVHLLIRRSGFRAPPWWHEGLAELYSTLKTYENKVELGEAPSEHHVLLARQGAWKDFAAVLRADKYAPIYNDDKTAELFYAQSWALVHMLYLSEPYRAGFSDFLKGLNAGTSAEELFRANYGKDLRQVQEDMVNYLQNGALGRVQILIGMEGEAARVETAPASDLQVQVTLANVYLGTEKRKQAAEILERLHSHYPQSWEVERSLGYLRWYEADRDAARLHFRRAVEKGMKDAAGYIDYTALLSETGVPAADLIPLLEKALGFQPSSHETRLKLASMYMSERDYAKALAAVEKIGAPKPDEAFPFHSLIASARLGLENPGKALESAQTARPHARTVTEQSQLDSLQRGLMRQESAAVGSASEAPAGSAQPPGATNTRIAVSDDAPPTRTPFEAERYRLKGKLERIDCFGDKLRLIFDVAGKEVALLILDPNVVTVKGKQTGTVAFHCGNQPDTAVSVTYTPKPDARLASAGIITVIEFLN